MRVLYNTRIHILLYATRVFKTITIHYTIISFVYATRRLRIIGTPIVYDILLIIIYARQTTISKLVSLYSGYR